MGLFHSLLRLLKSASLITQLLMTYEESAREIPLHCGLYPDAPPPRGQREKNGQKEKGLLGGALGTGAIGAREDTILHSAPSGVWSRKS